MQDDVGPVVVPAPAALAALALVGVAQARLLVLQGVGHGDVRHVRPVEVRGARCGRVPEAADVRVCAAWSAERGAWSVEHEAREGSRG